MIKKLISGILIFILFLSLYAADAIAFESSPIGWASVSDASGTPYNVTGGSAGATVIATDEATFKAYATSTTPYVIVVPTTITMTRGTSKDDTPQTVLLESNKTIIGVGYNPGINGGFSIVNKSNIIIRNLNIWYEDGTQGSSNPWTDGISMEGAEHIWVDHCNFFDSPDGLLDPTKHSNYITISWCRFYYTPESLNTDHHNANLVGSSDNPDPTDVGKLKETFHHNWWGAGIESRMPRVRYGQVHIFNNYYDCAGNEGYCVGVGDYSQILYESNYCNSVKKPWKDYSDSSHLGYIHWNDDNVFYNTTIPTELPNSTVFTPPYSYTLEAGSSVNTTVINGGGVNRLTPSPNPITFSVAPHALGSSSIAMTSSAATCADGVQYYFANITDPNHDSGWQSGSSYTDTGLSSSTTYTYTVQTRNQTQPIFTGAASSTASATTDAGTNDPPAAPTGLTATAGLLPVELNWNNNGEGDLAGYSVYRSTTSGSGYGKLNGTLLTDSNYIDDINTTNITYYYVVTATDTSSNESDNSSQVFSGLYGDFTGNNIVELDDLADFAIYWLSDDCYGTAGVDLDDDCMVNFYEFAAFAENWMQ